MRIAHKSLVVVLLGALIVGLIPTACGPSPTQPPEPTAAPPEPTAAPAEPTAAPPESTVAPSGPKTGGTLTIALAEDPRALDSLHDPGTEGNYVLEYIMEGLLNATPDGQLVAELAEDLPEMLDEKTYVFKLRQGVKFHDGTEFDAEDVKWTYDTIMDEDSGSVVWSWYSKYIESVEVLDKYTVKFTLKSVWPDFETVIASRIYGYIKSKEAFEKYGEDYGTKAVIGTGPFKFVEWVRGDHIALERNEDYWNPEGMPYVDRVVYKPITEDSTRLIAFKTGDVDVLFGVPFKEVEELRSEPGLNVIADAGPTIVLMIFNLRGSSVFKDTRLRQAISMGINREEVRDVVYSGLGELPDSIFPSWHWAHSDFPPLEYHPEKAKALLAEAGYDESNPLSFKLITTSVTQFVDTAVLVQAQLAEIGVNVEIEQVEKSALGQTITHPESWIEPPTVVLYRYIEQLVTSYYAWLTYSGKSTHFNDTGYNMEGAFQHPEVEELLDEADATVDQAKAKELYRQISEALREDLPDCFVLWLPNVIAHHDYVKDLQPSVFYQNIPLTKIWLDK